MSDSEVLQGIELTALLLALFVVIPATGSRRGRFLVSAGAVALFTAMAVELVPVARWLVWLTFVQQWWWIAAVAAVIILVVIAFTGDR